jgi:hypothetical protein
MNLHASPSGRTAWRWIIEDEKIVQRLTRGFRKALLDPKWAWGSARCSARLTHIALALQTTLLGMWFAYSGSGNVGNLDR